VNSILAGTRRRRLPGFLLPLALPALALLGGCGEKGAASGGGFSMPPMPVETAAVTAGTLVDRFTVVGSLAASEAITVVSEIDAAVIALPFREGQPIAAGALIAQLDDAELKAHAERALALRDQRQASHARVAAVVAAGAGSAQDLDDAAAALKVAEAELRLAETRLAKTRITAPFAGVLGARQVSPGAYLRAGTAIAELSRYDELRVSFSAPERLLGQLTRGAAVSVTTTAYPDSALMGTVDIIEPALDAATRSARVVARLPNRDRLLRPGMSAEVSVVLASRENALTLPSEAVFILGGQMMVYVVGADSTISPRPVSLGLRLADAVELLAGLAPGERVVRAGHQKIYPGAKVLPLPAGAGAPGSTAAAPAAPGGGA
jgi:membrane fusion protein (multidrug efflux system)